MHILTVFAGLLLCAGCGESRAPAAPGGSAGDQHDAGTTPSCTDDCTENRTQCNGTVVEVCRDTDGDGCTEWTTPHWSQCQSHQRCDGGQCRDRGTGDACGTHHDCPGLQICAGGLCAPMYGRIYLLSVTYLRLRRAATDADGSLPEPYVVVYAGEDAHEAAGRGARVGATGSRSDTSEASWDEQHWPVRLESTTGLRLDVWDQDLYDHDFLNWLPYEPPFPSRFIKDEVWAWERPDPDQAIQAVSGTIHPGGE